MNIDLMIGVLIGGFGMNINRLNFLTKITLSVATAYIVLFAIYPDITVWTWQEMRAGDLSVMLFKDIFWVDVGLTAMFMILFYWLIPLFLHKGMRSKVERFTFKKHKSDSILLENVIRSFYKGWFGFLFQYRVLRPKHKLEIKTCLMTIDYEKQYQNIALILHSFVCFLYFNFKSKYSIEWVFLVLLTYTFIQYVFMPTLNKYKVIISKAYIESNNKALAN